MKPPLRLPQPFAGVELHKPLLETTHIAQCVVGPGKKDHERICIGYPFRDRRLPLKLMFVAQKLHSAEVSRPLGTEPEEVTVSLRHEIAAMTSDLGCAVQSMMPGAGASAEAFMQNVANASRRFPGRPVLVKFVWEREGFERRRHVGARDGRDALALAERRCGLRRRGPRKYGLHQCASAHRSSAGNQPLDVAPRATAGSLEPHGENCVVTLVSDSCNRSSEIDTLVFALPADGELELLAGNEPGRAEARQLDQRARTTDLADRQDVGALSLAGNLGQELAVRLGSFLTSKYEGIWHSGSVAIRTLRGQMSGGGRGGRGAIC